MKNWPNTIQATREKKEQERIRKMEEEEIERRKVDAMEEALYAELRTEAVDRANQQMFEGQDRVKAFKSKMLVADMLAERDAQLALKKRKQKAEQQREKEWDEFQKQQLAEKDEKARKDLEKEYKGKLDNARMIKDQLHDFKLNYVRQMQEDMLEGELIKRQVDEELEKELKKEEQKREEHKRLIEEQKKANEDQLRLLEEQRRKEEEEQQRIEHFAKKKDQRDKLRRDKEEAKFREKQNERQKLIDRQIQFLASKQTNDVRILNKQVEEAEAKAAKLFQEQEKKRKDMKEAIERSRKMQMERRRQEKEMEKKDEVEFAAYWRVRNQELQQAEQLEVEDEKMRNQELLSYHKMQQEEKRKIAEDEFIREQKMATKAQALVDQQEKHFYNYAEKAIQDWQGSGKDVKPLVLELKGQAKAMHKA